MQILYDNLFAKDTLAGFALSSSGDESGFPVENIADWLDFDHWMGVPDSDNIAYVEVQFTSAQPANTFAIYGHDLATNSGSVKCRRYNSGSWTQVGTTLTPTEDGLSIIQFAEVSDTRWRLEFTSNPASYIGFGFIGKALALPAPLTGFMPPLVPPTTSEVNRAVNGALLGVYGYPNVGDIKAEFEWQTPSWVRSYWVPFMQHAQRKAFVVAWNDDDLSEAWWCWSEKPMENPKYETADWMSVKLVCRCTDGQ